MIINVDKQHGDRITAKLVGVNNSAENISHGITELKSEYDEMNNPTSASCSTTDKENCEPSS